MTYIIFPPSSKRKIQSQHKEVESILAPCLWFSLFLKFQTRTRIKWFLQQMPIREIKKLPEIGNWRPIKNKSK